MLTRGADFNMAASIKEKVHCVLEHAKTSSVTVVQRHFRTKFAKEAPHCHNIKRWVKQFEKTGCLCKGKSTGQPSVNNEVVENIRATYVQSPRKSTYHASRELNVPQATVWRVLRKRLQFKPYKFQMIQALKPTDRPKRRQFCVDLKERLEVDGFEDRLVFTDEATFHLCGNVNRHNLRFWGTENPHATLQPERDSPKVNVF
jgi:transposase